MTTRVGSPPVCESMTLIRLIRESIAIDKNYHKSRRFTQMNADLIRVHLRQSAAKILIPEQWTNLSLGQRRANVLTDLNLAGED